MKFENRMSAFFCVFFFFFILVQSMVERMLVKFLFKDQVFFIRLINLIHVHEWNE